MCLGINWEFKLVMSSIEIKGSTFSLTIIQIASSDKDEIERDLTKWISKAPRFFRGAPVVLQPANTCDFSGDDFSYIVESVRKNELIPVGVSTSNKSLIALALSCGLGVFLKNADDIYEEKNQKNGKISNSVVVSRSTRVEDNKNHWGQTRILNGPVRSGQQIYAKKSDLVVFGSIKPGAEVIADGNIQVYGKVRGKVLAGATGEINAFVYASDFKPEMIAIAGYYKMTDDIPQVALKKSVQVALKNDKVHFINM